MGAKRVYPPWSKEVQNNLRKRQENTYLHPYTCPKCEGLLFPRRKGWMCHDHGYVQDWAYLEDAAGLRNDP